MAPVGGRAGNEDLVLAAESVNFFHVVTQDDYERAKEKARKLLRSIVSANEWEDLEEMGILQLIGKRGIYIISPYSQTEIRDLKSKRWIAYSCLQLSIVAPTYDRMAAEYLLIKNNEDLYWKTANIFHRNENEIEIAQALIIGLDIALFANLLWEILGKIK